MWERSFYQFDISFDISKAKLTSVVAWLDPKRSKFLEICFKTFVSIILYWIFKFLRLNGIVKTVLGISMKTFIWTSFLREIARQSNEKLVRSSDFEHWSDTFATLIYEETLQHNLRLLIEVYRLLKTVNSNDCWTNGNQGRTNRLGLRLGKALFRIISVFSTTIKQINLSWHTPKKKILNFKETFNKKRILWDWPWYREIALV